MRWLLPVFFVVVSVGLFFGYIDTAYQDVRALQAEVRDFDNALNRSKELQAIRDALLARYNTFSSADIERLLKMLPDNIDNVRLVLEIDNIATRYGMRISNVTVAGGSSSGGEAGSIGPAGKPYETVVLSFNTTAPYENFVAFLKDLETSLRIVDVTALSFNSSDTATAPYDFNISIKTYWLK